MSDSLQLTLCVCMCLYNAWFMNVGMDVHQKHVIWVCVSKENITQSW